MEDLTTLLKCKEGGVLVEGVYPDSPGGYYYAPGL